MSAARHPLDDFDPFVRTATLRELAAQLPASTDHPAGTVNVHFHTFFSFNAEGYSPARIAWEAKRQELLVAGTVDFDVLDAMDEILDAGEILGLRTVAAMETRVFMDAFTDRDINSPGEPGVSYFMGTGFTRLPAPASAAGRCLARMRATADERNRALLARLGPHLAPLALDYEGDVRSLTPAGNATERHMLEALDQKARALFPAAPALAAYWAAKLGLAPETVTALLADSAALRNTIRSKLMKRGGPGYVQPGADTFPPIRDVSAMVLACEAIPCATWLDGTGAAEADAEALLDLYMDLGCLALNIIPDRSTSAWARPQFGDDRAAATRFYLEAGTTGLPPRAARAAPAALPAEADPQGILRALSCCA